MLDYMEIKEVAELMEMYIIEDETRTPEKAFKLVNYHYYDNELTKVDYNNAVWELWKSFL